MGEGDVQADESPLTRAANQLRIPLRERRKLSTAATEVAKSVADDDPARRSEHEEILRALESSAREVLAAAVRAQLWYIPAATLVTFIVARPLTSLGTLSTLLP